MSDPQTTPATPTVPPLEEAVDALLAALDTGEPGPIAYWTGRVKAARGLVCPACEKPRSPVACGHAYHQGEEVPTGPDRVAELERLLSDCARFFEGMAGPFTENAATIRKALAAPLDASAPGSCPGCGGGHTCHEGNPYGHAVTCPFKPEGVPRV